MTIMQDNMMMEDLSGLSNSMHQPRPRKYSEASQREVEAVDEDSNTQCDFEPERDLANSDCDCIVQAEASGVLDYVERNTNARVTFCSQTCASDLIMIDEVESDSDTIGERRPNPEDGDSYSATDNDISPEARPNKVPKQEKDEQTSISTSVITPFSTYSKSFLDSLPIADAVPEIEQTANIVAVVMDAVRLDSGSLDGSSHPRPSLINLKVYKEQKDTRLGIRFRTSSEGSLQIGMVTGKLAGSPLRAGDSLLSINGQNVTAWTSSKTVNFLRECRGWISITARSINGDPSYAQASVLKSNPADKLGISFESDESGKRLRIRNLNVAGLLGSRTVVEVGDWVQSINGIPCVGADNSTAVSIIRNASEWVNIVVESNSSHEEEILSEDVAVALSGSSDEEDEETSDMLAFATAVENLSSFENRHEPVEPAFISAMVYKESPAAKLGIALAKFDNIMYVGRLTQGGLLESSPLREGMRLISINNKPCRDLTVKQALEHLREMTGSIHFVAHNPQGNHKYVQAMVSKSNYQQNTVGISFRGSVGRQLRICEIRSDGLFSRSVLNVKDSVVEINGMQCSDKRPKDAVDIIRSVEDTVTIIAKTHRLAGVIVSET